MTRVQSKSRVGQSVMTAMLVAMPLLAMVVTVNAAPGGGRGGGQHGGRGGGGFGSDASSASSNSNRSSGKGGGGCRGGQRESGNTRSGTSGTTSSGSIDSGTTIGGTTIGGTTYNSTATDSSDAAEVVNITATVEGTAQNGTALSVATDSGVRGVVLTAIASGATAGSRVAVTGAVSNGILWAQRVKVLSTGRAPGLGQLVSYTGTVQSSTKNGTVLQVRTDTGETGIVLAAAATRAVVGSEIAVTGSLENGVVWAHAVCLRDEDGNYQSTQDTDEVAPTTLSPATGQLVNFNGTVEETAQNGTVLIVRSDTGRRGAVLASAANGVTPGSRVAITGAMDNGVVWARTVALVRPR